MKHLFHYYGKDNFTIMLLDMMFTAGYIFKWRCMIGVFRNNRHKGIMIIKLGMSPCSRNLENIRAGLVTDCKN